MSFLDTVGKVFGGAKSDSVVGVDIGSSSIKIVQLRKKGPQAVLETYGELSLGPYAGTPVGSATNLPQEKIIEALRDLLAEKEVNITTNLCGVAIPFSSSLMAVIELPEVSSKELTDMIPIEARKYIPVPISEVTLDWSIIPKSEGPSMAEDDSASFQNSSLPPLSKNLARKKANLVNVLIVAIHNETLSRMATVIDECKLTAGFFEIEIFSTLRSVVEENIQPVMILDMGAATTKLFIVERGILQASHTVNFGGQDITAAIAASFGVSGDQAEVMKRTIGLTGTTTDGKSIAPVVSSSLQYAFEEANRIIVDFEKKFNKPVSQIIMIGGGAALKGLNVEAKKNFQTEVISGDPFSKVVTPAFLEDVLRQTGPEFAVAVGLALRRLEEL